MAGIWNGPNKSTGSYRSILMTALPGGNYGETVVNRQIFIIESKQFLNDNKTGFNKADVHQTKY